tara:strand:+ start:341 stop:541 length:201 start_codon:yes stop_codon:yes gene_type:complete
MKKIQRYDLYFFEDSNYLFSRIFFKSLNSINAKDIEIKGCYDNSLNNTDNFFINYLLYLKKLNNLK